MSAAANIAPALRKVADDLSAAGVRTRLKRTEVTAPGAWLLPRPEGAFEVTQLDGSGVLHAWLYLVAPSALDGEAALTALAGLLDKADDVVEPAGSVDIFEAVQLTATATFPAFRLDIDIDI